jgi:prepilin-type N-terminal cleavage/methylation domain-containing protein
MRVRQNHNKGFTLVELLVIISIIGFLAALTLVALSSARIKSRDARRVSDIRQIISGLELYFNSCNSFPVEATAITIGDASNQALYKGTAATQPCGNNSGDTSGNHGGFGNNSGPQAGTYMITQLPAAITPSDGTCPTAGAGSSDGNPYVYTGNNTSYTLTFCLGGPAGTYSAGLRTATNSGVN